ncbi:MAG: hypothetical protein JW910_17585 [Anaerolineae bacterium]|nr:hypothetical protein [Anaerolineae bacterium]
MNHYTMRPGIRFPLRGIIRSVIACAGTTQQSEGRCMDCRHEFPIISLVMSLDWSNPILIWFTGFMVSIVMLVILAIGYAM